MSESILSGKKILAVDDEPDVLVLLEEEIMESCPNCLLDKATTYESAVKLLESKHYDVVILDIMGVVKSISSCPNKQQTVPFVILSTSCI